jgi:alpha-beta hydrolase superfamily lysophospholipase
VIEIDLSRYITLEDGLTIDDISRAFDRVLKAEFASLLLGKFHVIIHSTGALVVRNWLRRLARNPRRLPILSISPAQTLGAAGVTSAKDNWQSGRV